MKGSKLKFKNILQDRGVKYNFLYWSYDDCSLIFNHYCYDVDICT